VHPLLKRQLARYLPPGSEADARLTAFLKAVSEAYLAADDERELLERSLSLSSDELKLRYDALQRDIAERHRAERQRDTLFQVSPDLLCVFDERMHFQQVSPSCQRILGYSVAQLVGQPLMEIMHPQDRARAEAEAQAVFSGKSILGFETRLRAADGSYRAIAWTATVERLSNCIYAVARDMTDTRRLEADLRQAQKLEAVGQLASGVAHEINTPIQFVGDNLSFIRDGFNDLKPLFAHVDALIARGEATADDVEQLSAEREAADLEYLQVEIPKSLDEARDGTRRVAELVRALKEFAHPDRPEMTVADVNEAIKRTLVLARNEVKYVANIETELGPLPAIPCHAGALNQVFLNLLVNAAHAIEDRHKRHPDEPAKGTIKVSTTRAGEFIEVRFADSGCGIPAEVQPRIFEPFFTTKEVGRGTGQGLALARNIVVDKHHGTLTFDSTVDVGTTFLIRLPVAQRLEP
jgi:PAS domain S-box-containing protein